MVFWVAEAKLVENTVRAGTRWCRIHQRERRRSGRASAQASAVEALEHRGVKWRSLLYKV